MTHWRTPRLDDKTRRKAVFKMFRMYWSGR